MAATASEGVTVGTSLVDASVWCTFRPSDGADGRFVVRYGRPVHIVAEERSLTRERGRSVLVGAEDVRRDAGVADRNGRLEVAQGDRHAPVGIEALHVEHAIRARVDLDQPAEGAPLDPVRGKVKRLARLVDHRKRQGHRGG